MSCKTTSSASVLRRTAYRHGRGLAAAVALTLNACAIDGTPSAPTETLTEAPAETPVVPPDAIPVAPELYMRPMGTDDDGCPVFQPWSPTLAVIQALHWRTPEGDFTLDRAAADCP